VSIVDNASGSAYHVGMRTRLVIAFGGGKGGVGKSLTCSAVATSMARLGARARLRTVARVQGDRVMRALIDRGDTVYRLEPGAGAHRLVGIVSGGAGSGAGRGGRGA
jgi:Mrp family chromosome partitioning ATPase